MAQLKTGDKAPAFALKAQTGKTVKLPDFKGRKLLVFFYPKADTPGCTKQSCAVRDARKDFAKLGGYDEAPGLALDGDGVATNVLRAWNCYLTDAKFTPGTDTSTDAAGSGFELLYFNSDTAFKGTCELIIDD